MMGERSTHYYGDDCPGGHDEELRTSNEKEHTMGMLSIKTWGSFPSNEKQFSAMERGHAHAVADAIAFLSDVVLPEAIERDHRLHAKGATPTKGFDRANA